MNDTSIEIRLPSSLKQQAQERARTDGYPLSAVVRILLRLWLRCDIPLRLRPKRHSTMD